jgi:hypothetical protein
VELRLDIPLSGFVLVSPLALLYRPALNKIGITGFCNPVVMSGRLFLKCRSSAINGLESLFSAFMQPAPGKESVPAWVFFLQLY